MAGRRLFSIGQLIRASALVIIPGLAITTSSISVFADVQSDLTRLIETGACPACNLSNANLSGADLEGADLSGATLIGVDLSGANLQHADLSRALLNGASLGGADFSFANLRNASLQGAIIRQPANFTGADLTDVVMPTGATRAVSPASIEPSIESLTDVSSETIENNVPAVGSTPVDPRFPLSESRFPIDPFAPRPSAADRTPDGSPADGLPADGSPANGLPATAQQDSIDPRFPLLDNSRFPPDPLAPTPSPPVQN